MMTRERLQTIRNRFELDMEDAAHTALYVGVGDISMIPARLRDCIREERAVKHWFELRRGGMKSWEIALQTAMAHTDDLRFAMTGGF